MEYSKGELMAKNAATVHTETDETPDEKIRRLEDLVEQLRARLRVGRQTDETIGRLEEEDEQPSASKSVTVGTKTNKRLHDQDGLLLPGLPNEITLDKIVPKLPWRAFQVLSSVSRNWLQAIRNHEIRDARVRSRSTETVVILRSYLGHSLNLYSPRDGGYHRLPGIPHLETGSSKWICRVISLDGKIYAFGGLAHEDDEYYFTTLRTMEVWVMDLAGQRTWEQRASLERPKDNFGLGVLGRKIYVFGGVCYDVARHVDGVVRDSEVYDPKENTWSRIAPMLSWRASAHVTILGEELVLSGGYLSGLGIADPGLGPRLCSFWEVYHPVKDEWRILQPPLQPLGEHGPVTKEFLLGKHGKLHLVSMSLTGGQIDVYDLEKNTWSHLHSLSLDFSRFVVGNLLTVDDELLAVGSKYCPCPEFTGSETPKIFLRIKGFGGNEGKVLLWRRVWTVESPCQRPHEMCTIQL